MFIALPDSHIHLRADAQRATLTDSNLDFPRSDGHLRTMIQTEANTMSNQRFIPEFKEEAVR